eukprot:6176712-Pleurochrysis_carterae.AAC.1
MEIVAFFQTDYYVAGLAGVSLRTVDGVAQRDLLVLAYVCEPEDEASYGAGGAPPGGAQRPELRLITRENEEIFSDALSMSRSAAAARVNARVVGNTALGAMGSGQGEGGKGRRRGSGRGRRTGSGKWSGRGRGRWYLLRAWEADRRCLDVMLL